MTRVGTSAMNSLLLQHVMDVQARMQQTHLQITTERKYSEYSGLGLEANRAVNMENELATAERFIQNNTLAEVRLNATSASLEAVREAIVNFRSRLKTYAMGNPREEQETEDIQRFAFQAIKDIESYLNVEFNGDYLFAGSRTSREPVTFNYSSLEDFQADYDGDNTDDSADDAANGFATEFPNDRDQNLALWYQGDDVELKHRVDTNQEITIGIPASDPAFEKAIRAMALIAQGDLTNFGSAGGLESNLDRVNTAIGLLDESLAAVESLGHQAANNALVIRDKNQKHEAYSNFLTDTLANLQNVDMTEAVTRLMDDSRALEVSYNALARVRELSLTNYI